MESKGLIIGLSVLGLGVAGFVGYRIYKRKKVEKAQIESEAAVVASITLSSGAKVPDIVEQFRNAETENGKYQIISNALSVVHIPSDEEKLRNSYIGVYAWKDKELKAKAKSLNLIRTFKI
ncbi:MAG: hypothetical protein J5651_00180 [Salinivirgaceae bacterium]|nr:hypothetical protein [Salinivirgaceae bacterium]